MNLRRFSRYKIVSPATFTWNDAEAQVQGDGWTRDINQVGAFVYSTHSPPEGTLTSLQVILPPRGKEGRILKVYMDGHVLRVEANDSKQEFTGFAVLSVHITLCTTSEDGSEEILEDSEFHFAE